jgi:quercetin 2,3-dioxygenase
MHRSQEPHQVAAETCLALCAREQQLQPYSNRDTTIGTLDVSRALPVRGRRLVGPWCFLDRFGPLTFSEGTPMDVAPHPHIGLQTVTWLLGGEVLHDDSRRHESILRPGGLNVMTSGNGIAHAERTPAVNRGHLNGVQLWTALPDEHRHATASFQHLARVPYLEFPGGVVHVFSGALEKVISPAEHYSELLGADVDVHPTGSLTIPLRPTYEYAVLILSGDCSLDGQQLDTRVLYYLGTQRSEAEGEQQWWRSIVANRWATLPRDNSDVVELCRADAGRNPRRTRGLGRTSEIR